MTSQHQPADGDQPDRLATVPGCPPDQCGFKAGRHRPRCGGAPLYRIEWDTGRQSIVCGPHAAASRSELGLCIARIEDYRNDRAGGQQ